MGRRSDLTPPPMPPTSLRREGTALCLGKTHIALGPGNMNEGDLDLRASEQENWPLLAADCFG